MNVEEIAELIDDVIKRTDSLPKDQELAVPVLSAIISNVMVSAESKSDAVVSALAAVHIAIGAVAANGCPACALELMRTTLDALESSNDWPHTDVNRQIEAAEPTRH